MKIKIQPLKLECSLLLKNLLACIKVINTIMLLVSNLFIAQPHEEEITFFFFLLLATTINFWYGVVRRGRGRMPLREWKTNGKSGCCLDTQSLCYIGVIQLKNCIHLSKKNLSILYNSSPSYKNVWEGTTLKNISIYYFFPVGRN